MSTLEYFADFLLCPIYVCFIMHYNTDPVLHMIGMVLLGVLFWTFLEYATHRWFSHGWLHEQHDDHHVHPKDLVGNTPWMTFALTGIFWGLFWVLFDTNSASSLTSGLLIGYLIYGSIHVKLHHVDPQTFSRPMAALYRHHAGHHRGGRYNFGVTTTIWDRLLGTYAASGTRERQG